MTQTQDASHQDPVWYLDVEGTQSGPYSAEQLLGFLKEGEVLPHHRTTAAQLSGRWITLDDLLEWAEAGKPFSMLGAPKPPPPPLSRKASAAPPPPPPRAPKPPPPPFEEESPPPFLGATTTDETVVEELFSALQVAREKRRQGEDSLFVRVEPSVWDSPAAARKGASRGSKKRGLILLLLLAGIAAALFFSLKKPSPEGSFSSIAPLDRDRE